MSEAEAHLGLHVFIAVYALAHTELCENDTKNIPHQSQLHIGLLPPFSVLYDFHVPGNRALGANTYLIDYSYTLFYIPLFPLKVSDAVQRNNFGAQGIWC